MKKLPKRVLIIDDDPVTIRMLEKWLNSDGYFVNYTFEGKAGIRMVKDQQPDLVLLDIMMFDITGIEVARQLAQDESTKDIPIVFITVTIGVEQDKGDEEIEVDGKTYRAFAKPLHNRKLLSVIRKSINKRIHGNE